VGWPVHPRVLAGSYRSARVLTLVWIDRYSQVGAGSEWGVPALCTAGVNVKVVQRVLDTRRSRRLFQTPRTLLERHVSLGF
jgi:hypothetical protein